MSTLPLVPPKFQAVDANGKPLVGGLLYSYAAGTLTPQNTFTDYSGGTPNSNPIVLDGNGEANVWTTPGILYKFVLADVNNVTQWTVDNVPSGTIGSSGTSVANTITPGGRLTLTSGTPVTTTDVNGATTVIYTPLPGSTGQVPLFDGTNWSLVSFTSEISQALADNTKSPSAASDNNLYDIFLWSDSGTLRATRGPAWSGGTTRGTGAGTTELTTVGGKLVNANAISNGPLALLGLYLGTIFVNGTNHGVNDAVAFRHVWNAYNRFPRPMRITDAAASWTYSTASFRQANGNAADQLDFILGQQIESVSAQVAGIATTSDDNEIVAVGIGLDSASVNNAFIFTFAQPSISVGSVALQREPRAQYEDFPGLGHHTLKWLEKGGGTGTQTFYGTSSVRGTAGMWGNIFA